MNNKIAINTYQQLIKKQNKPTEEKQNHRYGERLDGCQIGRAHGDGQRKMRD